MRTSAITLDADQLRADLRRVRRRVAAARVSVAATVAVAAAVP
jgi:hypothetical protein